LGKTGKNEVGYTVFPYTKKTPTRVSNPVSVLIRWGVIHTAEFPATPAIKEKSQKKFNISPVFFKIYSPVCEKSIFIM
jgi:hypothetical protein